MRATAIRSMLAMLALGVLAACAGSVVVQMGNITPKYYPGLVGYIASRGGLPTEVVGNPFDAPDEQVSAVVRETMAKSHFGPDFPFLAEKPLGFSSSYRMVVVLGSNGDTGYHKLCAGVHAPGGGESGGAEIRMTAALCVGDSMVTGTTGRVSGVRAPDDPAFAALISQVTHELLPLKNEQMQDRENILIIH